LLLLLTRLRTIVSGNEALINQELAAKDPNLAETIGDILEIVVPFAEGAQVGRIRKQVEDGNLLQALKDTVAFGWAKADVRDKLRALPPEERRVLAQGVVDIVNSEAGVLLSNENELARIHQIRSFLEEGYYETEDMLLDSLIGALDLTLFASPVARLFRSFRRPRPPRPLEGDFIPGGPRGPDAPSDAPQLQRGDIEGTAEDVTHRRIETTVRPTTLSQTYRLTNPKKARSAHEAAAKDASGEAAEALYGTSRTEAVAHDLVGQIGSQSGRVKAKVSRADATTLPTLLLAGRLWTL
jgi:hypothetical protein